MSRTDDPTLDAFLDDLKSKAPTPGGGAVAGLTGSLAAALAHMVAALTVGKKKYADVADEFAAAMPPLAAKIAEFRCMMAEDMQAFDGYMATFRLPKKTDEDKAARAEAIRKATIHAAEVPLATIRACKDLLPFVRLAGEKGNRNAVSDAGVAALLVTATARAAALNVKINLRGLRGADHERIAAELAELLPPTLQEAAAIADLVESGLE